MNYVNYKTDFLLCKNKSSKYVGYVPTYYNIEMKLFLWSICYLSAICKIFDITYKWSFL